MSRSHGRTCTTSHRIVQAGACVRAVPCGVGGAGAARKTRWRPRAISTRRRATTKRWRAQRAAAAGDGQRREPQVDRAVSLAVPAGARPRHRSGSGDRRRRHRRIRSYQPERGRSVAARAHGVLRRSPAAAARDRRARATREAKATFDRKDYAAAEQQFREVLRLLDDPDMGGRLGDLRVLVTGFLDLSAAAAAPPPEPKKEEAPAPAPVTPAAHPRPSTRREDLQADDEGCDAADRRFARTCRACRRRSPIRRASAACST